jgi:hypothetical protein
MIALLSRLLFLSPLLGRAGQLAQQAGGIFARLVAAARRGGGSGSGGGSSQS